MIAVVVAAALVGGALLVRGRVAGSPASSPAPTAEPRVSGARRVTLMCPPEAESLCQESAAAFTARAGRGRSVEVSVVETPEAAERIAARSLRPLLWMPSSSAWIDRVNATAEREPLSQRAADRIERDLPSARLAPPPDAAVLQGLLELAKGR